ncbi:GNAT family N-acetyltransferase [candidate division KSB1 bacterium]|nr:GNAT family N-acetyltransferase [candidate division KSB1 bacterium]RQW10490.1 MAG: GNAT family N-acetyltransferase [candidate division KSB1 bacterium]
MNCFEISYKMNSASCKEIEEHLLECADCFEPPLDSYVDINKYSHKICKNAVTSEAWLGNKLVGLVACYLNNKKERIGYITNVSIRQDCQGQGIASKLLHLTTNDARERGFERLMLEVYCNNCRAIALYRKKGFTLVHGIGSKYTMIKQLKKSRIMPNNNM